MSSILYKGKVYGGNNSTQSIPSGGSQGQVLVKTSNNDYDVEWATPSGSSNININYDDTLELLNSNQEI